MSPHACRQIRQEADLIGRFAQLYRGKLAALVDQMNHSPQHPPDLQCLRLCVEAVDMVLESQNLLAKALSQLTVTDPSQAAAA